MNRILALAFILITANVCEGQFTDDFADGDFTANPAWLGTGTAFMVNAGYQLQLNNSVAGTSYLSTAFNKDLSLYEVEWQGYVSQTFSPSSGNFGRIYLVSNQADLTQPLNGYYLQFGEAGSADAPELFKQSGTVHTSVCKAATAGAIATSFALRYKVVRSGAGLWQLYVDYSGGTNFVLEASGTETTFSLSSYSGIACVYTITNANKFFYDDFSVQTTLIPDATPPAFVQVSALNESTIEVEFSEALDPVVAGEAIHYSLDHAIGSPASITLQPDQKIVTLVFSKVFLNGYPHQLTASGIKDLAGNILVSASLSFLYFQPTPVKKKDILITEILADPGPQVGLPDAEYIEIYNRQTFPVDLGGWKFSDGSSVAAFPSQIILPDEYWVVTAASNASKFNGISHLIALSNFPTLNNDGDILTLTIDNLTVDSVNYQLSWYKNVDKQEGGWSLELIDPENICGEGGNWIAAEDAKGGTPGKQNSVQANKPDLTGPKLISVVPVSPSQLILSFDEKLEKTPAATFTLLPDVVVTHAGFLDGSLREIVLDLEQNLATRQQYALQVANLHDCAGNLIQEAFSGLNFALAEEADSLEVVLNEVLFNPRTGGVDFVEIFNASPKYFNLKNWTISNLEDGMAVNKETITSTDFLFAPGTYLAVTPDAVILKGQYPGADEQNFITASLPGMPDDVGSVAVINADGRCIDAFNYDHKYHAALIQDEDGVSLERISASQPTQAPANWKSASSISGFATPGLVNSNARPDTSITGGNVVIDPEVFSPGSGYNDFTQIHFSFEQSNCVANVKVYDYQGHLVKTIANNETVNQEGSFRWDGDRDDGNKVRMGYYVVWFEVFDPAGSVRTFRKRVVAAARD